MIKGGKIYMSEKKKGIIKEQNHKLKMFSFLILISLIPLLIAILITSLMSVYMTKNYLEKMSKIRYILLHRIWQIIAGKMKLQL